MPDTFKEKLRSISFGSQRHRQPQAKTDELGNTTTEHFDGRVDVTINARPVRLKVGNQEER